MATQNETLLELRLGELELELIRLRRQVQKLESTPQPAIPPPAKSIQPAARTELHERRTYEFQAKLPPVRHVLDFRSHNKATDEQVNTDDYSPAQLERAVLKFARLQFIARKYWHGDKALFGVARRLFAQHSAIVRHHGGNTWTWCMWPHERRVCAAQIVAALSQKKAS